MQRELLLRIMQAGGNAQQRSSLLTENFTAEEPVYGVVLPSRCSHIHVHRAE